MQVQTVASKVMSDRSRLHDLQTCSFLAMRGTSCNRCKAVGVASDTLTPEHWEVFGTMLVVISPFQTFSDAIVKETFALTVYPFTPVL